MANYCRLECLMVCLEVWRGRRVEGKGVKGNVAEKDEKL